MGHGNPARRIDDERLILTDRRRPLLTALPAPVTVATTPAARPTFGEGAATLRGLGWTEREADWLALVCLHSGVFTRSQYQARYGLSKQTASRFARALLQAGIARETRLPDRRGYRPTSICHVRARALYRTLGIENDRHRRNASPEVTMRRLLSLDYVLEHRGLDWLPTEPEKRAYFQRLGISLTVLPHRVHRGPFTDRPTRRYFPLDLPIAGSGTTTTFVYADPGGRRRLQSDRLRAWVTAHAALWEALRDDGGAVHIVAVTRTEDAAVANAAILETWREPPARAVPPSEADRQLLDDVELATPPAISLCSTSTAAGSKREDTRCASSSAQGTPERRPNTSTPTPPTSRSASLPTCSPSNPPEGFSSLTPRSPFCSIGFSRRYGTDACWRSTGSFGLSVPPQLAMPAHRTVDELTRTPATNLASSGSLSGSLLRETKSAPP